ncbi:MAG TPA: hypothetical protein VH374_11680 [Polyangia bacterium]|nr:hypothetical protein [Polyangia bacterium]
MLFLGPLGRQPSIQDRLDANDTKAYLDAALYDQRQDAGHDSQSQK